jgi:hypothetical protein
MELRPGVFVAGFAKLSAEGEIKGRLGLEELAHAVEKQAKINASNGRHAYGTPTPARPGEGPARITGTLRRSVDHSAIEKYPAGWMTKVGPKVGESNPNSRTPPDKYGYYLETGLKGGATFPWLKPAAEFATKISAVTIFTTKYGTGWARVF